MLTFSSDMAASSTTSYLPQPGRLALSSSSIKPLPRGPPSVSSLLPLGERHGAPGVPQSTTIASASKTSVQVTVAGGQLSGSLGSVTIQAQQYLEGMWSISRVNTLIPQSKPVRRFYFKRVGRRLILQNFPPKTESQCFSFILQGLFRGKCDILRGEKPRRELNCHITAAVLTSHSAVVLEPTGSSQFKGHHNTYLPSFFPISQPITLPMLDHHCFCPRPLFPEFGSCHHLTHSVFISGFKSSVLFSSKNVFFLVICCCWDRRCSFYRRASAVVAGTSAFKRHLQTAVTFFTAGSVCRPNSMC